MKTQIEKLFVSKDITIALKNIGFDEPCLATYRGNDIQPCGQLQNEFTYLKIAKDASEGNYWLPVPMYQQVIDWFRNAHEITISITTDWNKGLMLGYCSVVEDEDGLCETETVKDYYRAVTLGILQAIKTIKKRK